jgi:NAD-reducing hydrogenase large subunit
MNTQKITIDPVTRVEGHGKVTVHLDEKGKVSDAFFHIVEFRGFERFIQGHPYWEAPVIVQRLCGICPVSHHLAAAKAIDQIVGIDPHTLPPAATKLRRLMHFGQVLQSHALHFFYLASPDLLFGKDLPYYKRNVTQVAIEHKELALRGIMLRKFGQEVIKAVAGKKIHGVLAVPGGVHKTLLEAERQSFLNEGDIPSITTVKKWIVDSLNFLKDYHEKNSSWMETFATFSSGHLGLVRPDGGLELYNGLLRAVNGKGEEDLLIKDVDYADHFNEEVKEWSFMKFPYLNKIGREEGWNRVGPLARMNVCSFIPTELAENERKEFFSFGGGHPINKTMYYHWARLIEMLHCAEEIEKLLHDPEIMSTDLRSKGERRNEGIGIIEAPRGTLIHHYLVDDIGMITKCNLIVSTTHNNEAMNRAVRWVADRTLSYQPEITESMLNQIEVAIRAYDPCLSCATHAIGQMPLNVRLYDHDENLIDEKNKS